MLVPLAVRAGEANQVVQWNEELDRRVVVSLARSGKRNAADA